MHNTKRKTNEQFLKELQQNNPNVIQFIEFIETLYNQGELSMERKILILERLNNIK